MAVLLVMAMMLVSCKSDPIDEPQPDDSQGKPTVSLIENGASDYEIIVNKGASRDLSIAALRVRSALHEATGVRLDLTKIEPDAEESAPTDTLEILIGTTNRTQSAEAVAALGENEYVIALMGKRLVITAATDEGAVAACEAFVSQVLGFSKESGTYAVNALVLEEGYQLKGTYTPAPVDDEDGDDRQEIVYEDQNAPTKSPETYVRPTYKLVDGQYVQSYEEVEYTGVMTTFQASVLYNEGVAINTDAVMVYSYSDTNFASWYSSGDYVIDMMIAVNRAGKDYLSKDKSNYEDIQMEASGNYLPHPTHSESNPCYYMVPSKDWIEFVWSDVLRPMIETYHPQTIALEEPEMWGRSGYSETFKKEWQEYYGEPWVDPATSAEATLKANVLKCYLFERILTVLSERVKALSPTTQVYVASHSTMDYARRPIVSGLNHYLATGAIDGVIGQTWSGTHVAPFAYNGSKVIDNFTNAFVEYASYVDSVEGSAFYALADPMDDDGNRPEGSYEFLYRQSIAAQLMQPEIHRFQVLPWVNRAYAAVGNDYRSVQSTIFEMLNDIGGEAVEITAGTPGITYLLSDTLSWMSPNSGWAMTPNDGMYAVTAPLIRDGIPVKMKAMDQITSAKDLEGVTLLLVSFDSSVPLSEEINAAIADWVKQGGTMLYVSGHNQYFECEDYFFWKDDGSPLANLFAQMGVNVKVNSGVNVPSTARLAAKESVLAAAFDGHSYPLMYRSFLVSFEGADKPILMLGDSVIGFEQSVGKGEIVVIGLPSAYLSNYQGGATMMRALTEYALQSTDYEYVSSDLMVAKRGKYTIAHAFAEPQILKGTYINLFDPELAVVIDPKILLNDSMVLVDANAYDLSVPRLGYSTGTVTELKETKDAMSFSLTSAGNTTVSCRILLPENIYFHTLTLERDGREVLPHAVIYDEKTHSLRVTFDGGKTPIAVALTFTSDKNAGEYSAYTVRDTDIPTNAAGEDAAYLLVNTARSKDNMRFCDNSGQLVYCFDLTEFSERVQFRFHVLQNYIVEVYDPEEEKWILVADYSEGGKVPHLTTGGNNTVIAIDPQEYEGALLNDELRVRLRNTDTSKGWGASITQIVIREHVLSTSSDTKEDTAWMVGLNNNTVIDDKAASAPSLTDESKFIVSTENGVNTYERKVYTNSKNEDADFLYFESASERTKDRYCDNNGMLIYYFDVSEMITAELTFHLYQNYLFEISPDGEVWWLLADASQGGKIPTNTTGGIPKLVTVNPFAYDCDETGTCFFRLRDAHPADGWGGTIDYFKMVYTKNVDPEAEIVRPEVPDAPRYTADGTLWEKEEEQDPDADYLISVDRGIGTYERTILTNQKQFDKEFLLENKGNARENDRYCDGDAYMVYCFDVSDMLTSEFTLHVFQNYLISVSSDGKQWTVVADYSKSGTVPTIKDGNNKTTVTIDPSKYGCDKTGKFYFRIEDAGKSDGWGGTITKIAMTFTKKTSATPSYHDEEYLINIEGNTATYYRRVATTGAGMDIDFIHSNTASSTDNLRFCDQARQLVYLFSLRGMKSAEYKFQVAQNYILEVSPDGESWTIVADYSQGGTVPHLMTGSSNKTVITIDPFAHGCDATEKMYVRLRNTDTSKGFGGCIYYFEMTYTREVSGNATIADPDEKYYVETKNGVKHYERKILTNASNTDATFLLEDQAQSTDKIRFCDGNKYLIYRFDLSDWQDATATWRIGQNYMIEISADGKAWTTLADYSEGGTVPWIGNASNMTDITVELFSRGCEESGAAYIRISTPWKDKGHGARLEYFTLNYTKAAN